MYSYAKYSGLCHVIRAVGDLSTHGQSRSMTALWAAQQASSSPCLWCALGRPLLPWWDMKMADCCPSLPIELWESWQIQAQRPSQWRVQSCITSTNCSSLHHHWEYPGASQVGTEELTLPSPEVLLWPPSYRDRHGGLLLAPVLCIQAVLGWRHPQACSAPTRKGCQSLPAAWKPWSTTCSHTLVWHSVSKFSFAHLQQTLPSWIVLQPGGGKLGLCSPWPIED